MRFTGSYMVSAYLVYLCIAVSATIMVARTLFKNGRVFLVQAFNGNAELADSVNHLLVAGFYLLNLGYVALALTSSSAIISPREAVEMVSQKVGLALVVLGGIHMFNLYVLNRMRVRAKSTWSRDL